MNPFLYTCGKTPIALKRCLKLFKEALKKLSAKVSIRTALGVYNTISFSS